MQPATWTELREKAQRQHASEVRWARLIAAGLYFSGGMLIGALAYWAAVAAGY